MSDIQWSDGSTRSTDRSLEEIANAQSAANEYLTERDWLRRMEVRSLRFDALWARAAFFVLGAIVGMSL